VASRRPPWPRRPQRGSTSRALISAHASGPSVGPDGGTAPSGSRAGAAAQKPTVHAPSVATSTWWPSPASTAAAHAARAAGVRRPSIAAAGTSPA